MVPAPRAGEGVNMKRGGRVGWDPATRAQPSRQPSSVFNRKLLGASTAFCKEPGGLQEPLTRQYRHRSQEMPRVGSDARADPVPAEKGLATSRDTHCAPGPQMRGFRWLWGPWGQVRGSRLQVSPW